MKPLRVRVYRRPARDAVRAADRKDRRAFQAACRHTGFRSDPYATINPDGTPDLSGMVCFLCGATGEAAMPRDENGDTERLFVGDPDAPHVPFKLIYPGDPGYEAAARLTPMWSMPHDPPPYGWRVGPPPPPSV